MNCCVGDLLGKIAAEGTPGGVGMPDEFGFVPAERDAVIAVPLPGGPRRGLCRDLRRQLRRICQVAQRKGLVEHGKSRLMRQQLAHSDSAFAGWANSGQ